MPLLSELAQARKRRYFLDKIPKQARILEIGCGSGWAARYLPQNGRQHYLGLDLQARDRVPGEEGAPGRTALPMGGVHQVSEGRR